MCAQQLLCREGAFSDCVVVDVPPRGGTSGLVFRLAPVAMDVTLICTGPALGVGAFGLICPSVAAGPGLAAACGLIRSLSAPLCGA